jgi:type IV secretory pathway component VirB8
MLINPEKILLHSKKTRVNITIVKVKARRKASVEAEANLKNRRITGQ